MSLVSIQNIEIVIPPGGGSYSGTISAVDPDNSIVIFRGVTSSGNSNKAQDASSSIVLTNATTVTVYVMGSNTANLTIAVTIIEDDEFVVQRGVASGSPSTRNISISTVDLSKTFAIVYITGWASGGYLTSQFLPTANLTTTTNLQTKWYTDFSPSMFSSMPWQVVSCDRWDVQKLAGQHTNVSYVDLGISSVASIFKTFVFGTTRRADTFWTAEIDAYQWILTDSSNLRLECAGSAIIPGNYDYCLYVVEDPIITVQRDYFSIGPNLSNTTTISSSNINKSFINRTCPQNFKQYRSFSSAYYDSDWCAILELTDSTTLTGKRETSTVTGDRLYYEIIEYLGSSPVLVLITWID
jgi:hypothetical protein